MAQSKIKGLVIDSRGQAVRISELTVGYNEGDDRVYFRIKSPGATRGMEVWVPRHEVTDAMYELFEELRQ